MLFELYTRWAAKYPRLVPFGALILWLAFIVVILSVLP